MCRILLSCQVDSPLWVCQVRVMLLWNFGSNRILDLERNCSFTYDYLPKFKINPESNFLQSMNQWGYNIVDIYNLLSIWKFFEYSVKNPSQLQGLYEAWVIFFSFLIILEFYTVSFFCRLWKYLKSSIPAAKGVFSNFQVYTIWFGNLESSSKKKTHAEI